MTVASADGISLINPTDKQGFADRDFILKAVNNHDALVKALEGIAEFCSTDATTLGALDRLTSIRNTAVQVLRHVGGPPK